MNDTIAKPIVNGKFWVIKQNNQKIGSVEKDNQGYFVTTKTKVMYCPKLIILDRYGYVGPVREPDGFYYK